MCYVLDVQIPEIGCATSSTSCTLKEHIPVVSARPSRPGTRLIARPSPVCSPSESDFLWEGSTKDVSDQSSGGEKTVCGPARSGPRLLQSDNSGVETIRGVRLLLALSTPPPSLRNPPTHLTPACPTSTVSSLSPSSSVRPLRTLSHLRGQSKLTSPYRGRQRDRIDPRPALRAAPGAQACL